MPSILTPTGGVFRLITKIMCLVRFTGAVNVSAAGVFRLITKIMCLVRFTGAVNVSAAGANVMGAQITDHSGIHINTTAVATQY
jgi:hypothetical protein